MPNNKSISLVLTVVFLVLIFGEGTVQASKEVLRGERPQCLDIFLQLPTEASLRSYEDALSKTSWSVALFRPWMQYARLALLNDMGEKVLSGRDGWLFYRPGVQYLAEALPSPELFPANSPSPADAITAFRDELAKRNIELLVLPMPNKETVYSDMLAIEARCGAGFQPASGAGWKPAPQSTLIFSSTLLETHTTRLIRELQSRDVHVLDIAARFRESRAASTMETETLYLQQDTHWSPAGVSFAAKEVAALILSQQWVEKGTTRYTIQPTPISNHGDLVRMMKNSFIENTLNPENFVCQQVLQSDSGGLYHDDPTSSILIMGDSFLRIFELDEPRSAGFIAHLALELGMPMTSIVNDGGASTLVRQELQRKPQLLANKKLVIWEFVERDIRFGTEGWMTVSLP